MTVYTVDSEAVLSATSAIRASMARLQAESDAIRGTLANLQGSWTGQASSAFHGVAEQWQGTQRRLEEGLDALGRALGTAGSQYADVEAANARLFAAG